MDKYMEHQISVKFYFKLKHLIVDTTSQLLEHLKSVLV